MILKDETIRFLMGKSPLISFFLRTINQRVPQYVLRYGSSFGWCPICEKRTVFYKRGEWLRDDLRCVRCNSIPRWRALIHVLETHFPEWHAMHIHESSPGGASSQKIQRECALYTPTYYYEGTTPGSLKNGIRCENLEQQTFPDGSFDLVITQDVFEHILNPAKAFSDIARTLKPKGAHIFTVPWYFWKDTVTRAIQKGDDIQHLLDPAYHKNPIDPQGSLVVTEWGRDICEHIYKSSGMTTTVIRIHDLGMGISGKFIEVFISMKSEELPGHET